MLRPFVVLVSFLCLPSATFAASLPTWKADGPTESASWNVVGKGELVDDERLKAKVIEIGAKNARWSITPVAGAKEYQVWVSAYADGRGATPLSKGPSTEPLVNRLRPGVPLHFFVTYTAEDGATSKPSPVATITLKDEFVQK